jgi:hypothetical protein
VSTGLFSDFPSGSGLITDGLLPETEYEVRARLITVDGQRSPFIDFLFVVSGAGFFSNDDFEGGVQGLFEDAGISAPEIVSALPTTGNFVGRFVYLTTDQKLFSWNGTEWVGTETFVGPSSITTGLLAVGAVEAQNINVNQLSAITAQIGLLRTASTGERVEIEDNRIRVFDSSNVVRVVIGDLS